NDFEGAVMVISHDRHLIEATVDRLWIAVNGTISEFDDDLDGYQRLLTGGRPAKSGKPDSEAAAARPERKAARQATAALREETAHLRKAIKRSEAMIERFNRDLRTIGDRLADPALYEGDPGDAVALTMERARLENGLEEVEAEWLQATGALEAAEKAQAAQ
ncbi:MAG TPA: ABC transporter ATP-binding protein, partial [Devosiaceae bacterium]|nr:ABC transporter ATP-binding protein [Devosiaceae bacterium]